MTSLSIISPVSNIQFDSYVGTPTTLEGLVPLVKISRVEVHAN